MVNIEKFKAEEIATENCNPRLDLSNFCTIERFLEVTSGMNLAERIAGSTERYAVWTCRQVLLTREWGIRRCFEGDRVLVGTGFFNLGNTCFLNSTLQALFHNNDVVKWLENDFHHRVGCTKDDCITCTLHYLCLDSKSSKSAVAPEKLVSNLNCFWKDYKINVQQDAQEFLCILFNRLNDEFLLRISDEQVVQEGVNEGPISAITEGSFTCEIHCTSCSKASVTTQPIGLLPLPLEKATKVEDCLQIFFTPELINEYNCPMCCKTQVAAIKRLKLREPPKVLICYLKRFNANGTKIFKNISVQETLSVSDFMETGTPCNYSMFGSILHGGKRSKIGHYVTVVKNNEKFYQFNDSQVQQVTENELLTNKGYIYFYKLNNN
ncbi:ubiquitin carboxyl-terminal hydrolase 36-like [Thrips palmi]|uniref:Ubiquitin carboxyl-terminal hydrolase 36 n=1 Tax=Thrips palmi TaxID=161013 RepID=A0A6P8YXS5_THRPL|nr:ubiquitin carboxyl-terminal hydrolase 36-like [Thrips palmi]